MVDKPLKTVIFTLSERNRVLAERLGEVLEEVEIHCTENVQCLQDFFKQGYTIIGICSSGILIRCLASVLSDKVKDPAVIAVAEDGTAVVPLLGGHRGANTLAQTLAETLNIKPAITTASDSRWGVTLDVPPLGWRLGTPTLIKPFLKALLEGTSVRLEGKAAWLEDSKLPWSPQAPWTIRTTITKPSQKSLKTSSVLVYHPTVLALGVGCESGIESEEVGNLAQKTLEQQNLAVDSLALIATIESKATEPALHILAQKLGLPLRLFSSQRLEQETPRLLNPSEYVYRIMGCHGVAESAALAATGREGRLIVPKQKSTRATCAIAQADAPIDPQTVGRDRGRLAVVGLGPGKGSWRSQQVTDYLQQATDIVGYQLYLDLLDDDSLKLKAERHPFQLGAEVVRARFALDLAANGKHVVLVSSGDPGIYAMAAIVLEILEHNPCPQWEGLEVLVCPGISAMQAVAATVGAPLGHDFCVISLSDLMTSWSIIETRVLSAAQADFILVLYNPASRRRNWQFQRVQEILALYRAPDTPVVIGRNLGRTDESVSIVRLHSLESTVIDMLSLVIVGNSKTRYISKKFGKSWVYTPRYAFSQNYP